MKAGEISQIWAIRLKRDTRKYLTVIEPCITWADYRSSIKFNSKYQCKKTFRQIAANNKCEMYRIL